MNDSVSYVRQFLVSNTGLSQKASIWKTLTNSRVEHTSWLASTYLPSHYVETYRKRIRGNEDLPMPTDSAA